jgi:hypothetical protein
MKTSITRRVFVKRTSGVAAATVLGMHLLHDIAYATIDQGDSRQCFCFFFNSPPAGDPKSVTLSQGMGREQVQQALIAAGLSPEAPVACTASNENKSNDTMTEGFPATNPPSMRLTFANRTDGVKQFICAKFPLKIDGVTFK